MITTKAHGGIPEGIRDHHNVFGQAVDNSPQAKLGAAISRVKLLQAQLADAQRTFKAACDDDRPHDLQALKAKVSATARELEAATTEQGQWEQVCEQTKRADDAKQFGEKVKQAQEARKKFAELYQAALLELKKWRGLAVEVDNLAQDLADHLPNGTVYYRPELKNAVVELELPQASSWWSYLVNGPILRKE